MTKLKVHPHALDVITHRSGLKPLPWHVGASKSGAIIQLVGTIRGELAFKRKNAYVVALQGEGYRVVDEEATKKKGEYFVYVSLPRKARWQCTIAGCLSESDDEDLPPAWYLFVDSRGARSPYCSMHASTGRKIAATIGTPPAAREAAFLAGGRAKIGGYEVHPAAEAFPLMGDEELAELAADIKANGLQVPPELVRGLRGNTRVELLLDGRNRLRACELAGVKPRFEYYTGKDPVAHVITLNLKRRHLNETQRATAAAKLADLGHGGDRRDGAGVSRAEASRKLTVSERSVDRASAVIKRADPEVVKAMERGVLKVSAAEQVSKLSPAKQRELVKRIDKGGEREVRSGHVLALVRQEEKRDVVRKINTRPLPMPRGPFRQIVIDFPWRYENSDGHAGVRGHTDYPTMSMDEIIAMCRDKIAPLADPTGAALWLWFTNGFVDQIGNVVRALGAKHQSMATWLKTTKDGKPKVGLAPTNMRGATEHVVLATIGKAIHHLNDTKTWFEAPVREPGRKPDEFFAEYTTKVAGPNLELFSREPREGWVVWGAETELFAKEAA